jgi:hypothetical protein
VAFAFLENPNNYPTVDHIDRVKKNNSVTNLQWASREMQNQNKYCVENASNIYYNKKKKYYQVTIMRNGERNQNCFKTEQDAVKYRNDVLAKYA